MQSRLPESEYIQNVGHRSISMVPPPHFRRRYSNESSPISTIDTKTPIKRNYSNKRKQEESLSFEERNTDSYAIFKRQMTSKDDNNDESRDASSSALPSSSTESRDHYREISRVGSSELASAMALTSLARGMIGRNETDNRSNSKAAIMRPRQTSIADIIRSKSHQQELLSRSISSTSSYGSFGLAMNNLYLHDQTSNHPMFTLPSQAYLNRQIVPPPIIQHKPQRWICDFCNEESFDSYEEACKHEQFCVCNKRSSEAEHTKDKFQKTPAIDKRKVKEHSYDADTGVYFEGAIPLAVPATDRDWLSDTNCFVRSTCVEAFSAKKEDIMISSKRGRISLHQVGIRCKFCSHVQVRSRGSGAVSFPVSVYGIYESVKRWKSVHLQECRFIPKEVKEMMVNLENTATIPTTRQYWIDSARALGIDDTVDGLRFVSDPNTLNLNDAKATLKKTRFVPNRNSSLEKDEDNERSSYLVFPEDKATVTPYVYCLMRQVQPCVFTEADRFLSRSKSSVGFPGFECRHCHGHAGLGRYFPSSPKALSTNSTSQNIFSHIQKCRKCPQDVKDDLLHLKTEKPTWLRRTCGWRQAFFQTLWERLHG